MSYKYDSDFFDFVNTSSGRSAKVFLDKFIESTLAGSTPDSVLDVGCGRGVWLAEWLKHPGVVAKGVDGDYVERKSLLVPEANFLAADISKPLDLGRRYDLVECLEVAEHIPSELADTLIDSLTRHSDLVLFSAATPGQGGEFHVNERPHDYWRAKFASRGYATYDAIRSVVRELSDIEPWYRFNAFVFANPAGMNRLSPTARGTFIPDGVPAPNVAPTLWRLRCMALSTLPPSVASDLARLKHRVANRWQGIANRR